MNVAGIYAIVHKETKRLYIGSAVNIRKRWGVHRCCLRRGDHHSRKLQNSWGKHGEAAFEFMVVHPVEHAHELITWEQFWIDRLAPHYNMRKNAESSLGHPVAEETKAKLRIKALGRKHTAASRSRMSESRKGTKRSDAAVAKSAATRRGVRLTPQHRANISAGRAKTYTFISPAGETIEVVNLLEFCKANGLDQKSMWGLHNGLYTSSKGWTASGAKQRKAYEFADPDGAIHSVKNLTAFCRERGLNYSVMNEVKLGRRPHHKGWRKA